MLFTTACSCIFIHCTSHHIKSFAIFSSRHKGAEEYNEWRRDHIARANKRCKLRDSRQTVPKYHLPLSSPSDVCVCCSNFSEFTRVRLLQRQAVQRRGGDSIRVRVDLKTQHVTRCRSEHQQCKLRSHMRGQAAAAVTVSAAPAAAPPRLPRILQTELPAVGGAG